MCAAAFRGLRLGGVPEHFNWPFRRAGKELRWTEFPGGSGAMAAALKDGRLDVAVMLTEALVAQVAKGAPFKLWGAYTSTPLVWGVHTAANFVRDPSVFGVSRYGSGSHVMALVDARAKKKKAA